MAAVNAGAVTLQAEGEKQEPPEEMAAAVAAPRPWPAAMVERYERREKLGQGMFGDVYRAWDRVDGRFVVVKRLAGRTGGGFVQVGIRHFQREAMSLAACRGHPSVVQLLATDAGRGDGEDCFLVTEYAGPKNLRQFMESRRREGLPFDEDEVREAMRQLLAGVEHAHGAGVLHMRIVPENVIVGLGSAAAAGGGDKCGTVVYKICGFGASETGAERGDGSGLLASPSSYRAPELFVGSRDYDGRVDTWGLGCIMAELLAGAGAPLFVGGRDSEVLGKMLRVVGADGIVRWPGLERVATRDRAARVRKAWRRERERERGHLRELFPPEVLSPAGFRVLKGLLRSDPDRRLTAAAALRMPWFRRRGGCFMA